MERSKTDCPPVSVEITHSLIEKLTVAASNDGDWSHVTVDCPDLFIATGKITPIHK